MERGVEVENDPATPRASRSIAFLDDAATHLVEKKVVEAVDDAVEKVILNDDLKKKYLSLAGQVVRLYKAILPDPKANDFAPMKTCFAVLAEKIRSFTEEASIEDLMEKVGQLLDESVAAEGYRIGEEPSVIDLSQIDFDALKAHFEKGRKHTEAEKLKGAVSKKLQQMVQLNKTRTDLLEKFKKLIEEYNKGLDVDGFFEKLVALRQGTERGRTARRGRATDGGRTGDLRHSDEADAGTAGEGEEGSQEGRPQSAANAQRSEAGSRLAEEAARPVPMFTPR